MGFELTLHKIECLEPGEGRADDLFIQLKADEFERKTIPHNPGNDNSWSIGKGSTLELQPSSTLDGGWEVNGDSLRTLYTKTARVWLWDYDRSSANESLGGFDVGSTVGHGTADCKGGGGHYKVYYEVTVN